MNAEGAVQVRPATVQDAARIAEVHVRSWQSAYRGLLPHDYLDSLDPADRVQRWQQVLSSTEPARGGVLVATDADVICGFASVGPTRDQDESQDHVGEVMAIYLAPGAWGKGYGRELMTASLRSLHLVGYLQATLWVLDANMRARRFYEIAGFQPDGARKVDDREEFQLQEIRYRRSLP
jgi:RimJ/RimL family protein N-acetyltransferase